MIIQCMKKVLDVLGVDDAQLVSLDGFEQFPESLFTRHAFIARMRKYGGLGYFSKGTLYFLRTHQ